MADQSRALWPAAATTETAKDYVSAFRVRPEHRKNTKR
jgi:hypothetical protein